MVAPEPLVLGEYARNLDDRFRLSIPSELADRLIRGQGRCVLAKERAGCLSLWDWDAWNKSFEPGLEIMRAKLQAGRLASRLDETQHIGRLLSARHRQVELAGRSRLTIPEGFREFLRVEPGSDVTVIGAAVCIEIWHPRAWTHYLRKHIPDFQKLFEQLTQ